MSSRSLILLSFFSFFNCVWAQESSPFFRVGVEGGYMMPNNMEYSQYSSPTYGLDVAMMWTPVGDSYWQRFWGWPAFGVKGAFLRIPNSVAGDWFGLEGLMSNPLGNRWEWQMGLGLSFYTRPYALTGDRSNIFIGSMVNCLIDLGIGYQLCDAAMLSIRLLHTSNGMLYRPNMGLNYLQVDLAWEMGKREMRNQETRNLDFPVSKFQDVNVDNEWSVALSGGAVMARDTLLEGYYGCYDVTLYFQQYVSPVFAFGGAIDVWYNDADRVQIKHEESDYRLPLYLSGMGVVEFFWGPLSLKAGLGLVVAASPQVTNPIYERVGAYYNFGRNYIGVALNAHAGRIEYIEWTYGRRFF